MRRLLTLVATTLIFVLFVPAATAQDASPAAGPIMGECVAPEIPPGTPSPMESSPAMEASPPADMEQMDATPEAAEPEMMASPEIPAGEAAPDDVVAAVEGTLANAVHCLNGGMYVEFAALHTPDGLMQECGTTNVYDAPMCFEGIPPVTNFEVPDVQVHDDGRVSADVVLQFGSFLIHERLFFVAQDDGTYLMDVAIELPVEIPEGATVIDGEMVDFAFELSQDSAPAGDIAFNLTNTGEYPHEMVAILLPEGITVEDVFEDESLFAQVQFFGFTFAEPGQTANPLVLVDMQPGTYTLVCFVDVPDGIPHVARGMITEFEVTAP